jgi:hypothetical protein
MYDVVVICDCGCEKRQQVPQVGAVPTGWVGVTWPERVVQIAQPGQPMPGMPQGMPIGPGTNPQPTIEQRTMLFSSWRCVNKHVKAQLTGAVDKIEDKASD